MAKSRSEALYNDAARKQEVAGSPAPTDIPEQEYPDRPPLTPSQIERIEVEARAGREANARYDAERRRILEQEAERRAKTLAEGKTSTDDLS